MKARIVLLLMVFTVVAMAGIPLTIQYQGKLTDMSGIGENDTLDIRFRVFDIETGGDSLWAMTVADVPIVHGLFDVNIGPIDLPFDEQYWLEIVVDDNVLAPRVQLTSSPYAFRSAVADSFTGGISPWSQDTMVAHWDSLRGIPGDIADGDQIIETRDTMIAHWDSLRGVPEFNDNDWTISGSNMYSTVSGNVGVGTTTPHTKLHVQAYDDTVGIDDGVFVNVSNICDDSSAISGIRFKTRGTTDSLFYKGAIAFQRTTPQGRGNILFLNNDRANNTNADISDVQMTITPAGDVGIGTMTPNAKVEISSNSSSTTPTLLLHETDADAARIRFTNDDTTTYFTISAKPADTPETSRYTTYFYTTPIISFMGDGNVGIGTLSPSAKLDVSGLTRTSTFEMTTGAANGYILQSDASGNASWASPTSISDGDWTVDGDDLYSAVSGNVGVGLVNPDAKLQVCGDFEVVTGDYYMYVTDRSTVITYSTPRLPCDVSYGIDCPDTVITYDLGPVAYDQVTHPTGSRSYVYERVGTVKLTIFGVDTTASTVEINADMDIAGDVGISGKIGIGTTTPARRLHVSDIMRLEPRPTAPSSPSEGDMYMNSTTHKLMVYDGSAWQACW